MQLNVRHLPQEVAADELADADVVVVDLLRASSTICYALAAGATAIVPLVDVDAARAEADRRGRAEVLLGGERGGLRIDGFDLGNSPAEYRPDVVAGQAIVFTTTNGARALDHARAARRVFVGALVNCRAVVAAVLGSPRVEILCAGTDGQPTGEDILAAGAMVQAVIDALAPHGEVGVVAGLRMNDAAFAALCEWSRVGATATRTGVPLGQRLVTALDETRGGRNLLALGLEADVAACAQLDQFDLVPLFNPATGEIRPM